MKVLEYVKQHPWMVGGAVVITGALFLLFFGGSGSGDNTPALQGTNVQPSDASIQAGMAVQSLQAQVQAHTAEVNAAKEVSLATVAADLAKTNYANLTSFNVAQLAADTHARDVAADITKSTLAYKLSSQQSSEAFKAQQTVAAYSFKEAQTKVATDKQIALSKLATDLKEKNTAAATAVTLATIQKQK